MSGDPSDRSKDSGARSEGPTDRSEDPTDRSDWDFFDGSDDDRDGDPFSEATATDDDLDDPFAELEGGTGVDPFAELDGETGPLGDDGDPFERMEVDEVDVDGVWDALDADPDDLDESGAFPGTDPREATDHVVDKRTYCQRCPHFTDPPETACTHEGTSILEAIGFAEFRVRDCPMVTEDGPRFERPGDREQGT
ncbi:hypothetical protein [Halorubrum sp. 48-1-W]|uniref:hypothetical protein n=1 Tax=Halorubrum sp. 48-1-W TaxID=2249761 RepID=UPI0018E55D72|nr:hypothetical protein [Halorubrum sp. 48-1-W]